MPRRNPFEEPHPHKRQRGEDIVNLRRQRVARVIGPDGSENEIVLESHDSRPLGDGSYVDTDAINLSMDADGNVFPHDPQSIVAVSHTGLFITSPDQFGICTSRLHGNRSPNIFLGRDGRAVKGGAICSRCDFWLGTIYIALGVGALGLVLGIWKAAGVF